MNAVPYTRVRDYVMRHVKLFNYDDTVAHLPNTIKRVSHHTRRHTTSHDDT